MCVLLRFDSCKCSIKAYLTKPAAAQSKEAAFKKAPFSSWLCSWPALHFLLSSWGIILSWVTWRRLICLVLHLGAHLLIEAEI